MGGAILAVDDNEHLLTFLVDLQTFKGFTVRAAAHGRQALEMLADWTPDVILLDLMMPVMNGLEFLARRQDDPALMQIPVVAITGNWTLATSVVAADAVLAKPFMIDQLLDQIVALLPGAGSPIDRSHR
jgi:CheY-like chemotaxis protein